MKRIYSVLLVFVILGAFLLPQNSITAVAADDTHIIVSMGDSYSSGEGIPPFYGQNLSLGTKVNNQDWLAHRSENSWPGMLEIDGHTMKNYRKTGESTDAYQWYFVASSGATSLNIGEQPQIKEVDKRESLFKVHKGDKQMDLQTDIFRTINKSNRYKIDYVTLTIGGNDVEFADIVQDCVLGSTHIIHTPWLDWRLNDLWNNIWSTKSDIKRSYQTIRNNAGSTAHIIVAGYPTLFERNGKGGAISKDEAVKVNDNVSRFNKELKAVVEECQREGMKISFVDVESTFAGHEAYSEQAWINPIMWGSRDQDLKDIMVASAYSMHPNATGAEKYAKLVNGEIARLEELKHEGTLYGKVLLASDESTPVSLANVIATRLGEENIKEDTMSGQNGDYKMDLVKGQYKVEAKFVGYVPFVAYAEIERDQDTHLDTFLMIKGDPNEKGIAKGLIKNAATGRGVPDANISVYKGWNNSLADAELVTTGKTDSNGNYQFELPLGNYTLRLSKAGYIDGSHNIFVQKGTTNNKDGAMTPIYNGEAFRIVLSWGLNPNDLDSHVVGPLANGSLYHVYFNHKSQYDGTVEVCNLDVDDTTSFGPETITLKAEQNGPYYYYIHRYAGSGSISTSEANITIYQNGQQIRRFSVPTNLGTADYWNVFAIVNGQIIPRNTMTNAPDTSYAGNGINSSLRLMRAGTSFLDELLNLEAKKDGDIKEAAASASTSVDEKDNESTAAASSSEDVAAASTSGTSDDKKSDGAAISKSVDDENAGESSSAASSSQNDASKIDASLGEASVSDSGAENSSKNDSDNAGTGNSGTGNSGSQDEQADNATEGSCVD